MKYPKGERGLYARFAKWLFEFYKKLWVQFFAAPVILAVPPAFITGFYGNKTLNAALTTLAPGVATFLAQEVIAAIAIAALYPTVLLVFAKSVVKQVDARGLNIDSLLMVAAAIDNVVGSKSKRFAAHASNHHNLSRDKAFEDITQPTKQIAEITRAVCDLFNALRTEKKRSLIRVVLATLDEQGQINGLPVYYPQDEPVRSTIEALNNPASAIRTAARSRRIVIIESIGNEFKKPKEKRKFVDTGNEEDNEGSLICYPVVYGSGKHVPYVISIHCDVAGYFKEAFRDLYEHTLQRFALRLSLEHSLFIIKENICEPNSQQA